MAQFAIATNGSPATAMSPRELLFPDLDQELATTRRMLERVPDGHEDWRPHEKSMTLGNLAGHLAQLPGFGSSIIAQDVFHGTGAPIPTDKTTAERLKTFDTEAARFRELVENMTWQQTDQIWKFMIGDRVGIEGKRAQLVRIAGLTHMAHHRAQLGVYLRVLNVPIPGSYGPSADEGPGRR
jgi:uncharacterized damage-inducible protein DinB